MSRDTIKGIRRKDEVIVMYAGSKRDLRNIIRWLRSHNYPYEVHEDSLAVVTIASNEAWDYAGRSKSVSSYTITTREEVEKNEEHFYFY